VLEERTVCPVGSDTELPVDVRVIAATHRNLEEMVAAGTFRADLYFRLAVVPVALPPLRDRAEDIIRIAELCVARVRDRIGRDVEGLDESAKAALTAYHWPGNVRELSHMIERAVLLARRPRLSAADLSIPAPRSPKLARGTETMVAVSTIETTMTLDLRSALENLERDLIDRALAKAGGNRTEAAALLGLNRTTLVEKLRKYAA
jgi:transcriptional regulator with PAS, ATPase and Fis domain